jgi:1-acyl-sn-glycerol-3-phosphate acyltransferase
MRKKVYFRWPRRYSLLYAYVSVIHRLYYRRITVVGFEKIPVKTPVIFAANHQNALMDALAVLFAARKPVVFLARADIFKKPLIAKLLNFLKILPIYRIRDGAESLSLNQEVFDNTVDVLKSDIPICILPEGNHEGLKRLRPLKKGIFRIAFQAEESTSYNLDLHIIPVGIDYSNYFVAGSDLMIVFGKPIKIAEYADQYRENEQKTIYSLMGVLSEGMKSVMIDIPEEYYKIISAIIEMYEPNVWNTCNIKRHPYNKLTIKQYLIQKISEAFAKDPVKAVTVSDGLKSYHNKLSKTNLNDCQLQQRPPRFLSLIIKSLVSILLLPVHVYGLILNYLPYKVPVWLASKIKDLHFRSSVQFGISLLLFPLYYMIIIAVFCLLAKGHVLTMLFALSLPVSGLFTLYNYKYMVNQFEQFRLLIFRLTKNNQFNALYQERVQLIELIKSIINS